MSKYIFHEGHPAENFKTSFERFLFNEERHRLSQSANGWNTFSLIDEGGQKIVAQIHFCIEDGIALSPLNAPFGSIEFAETLSAETLCEFLIDIENNLKKKGAKRILIKDMPHLFRPSHAAILTVLFFDLNFKVIKSEINSSIIVDEVLWKNKISEPEFKRLKRCEKENLSFQEIRLLELEKVYRFIEECRRERGAELSMTYTSLKRTAEMCPNDFLLFGVFRKNKLIASSISVRVSGTVLYNFYHAHQKSSDNLSPIVFLLDNQYLYCRQNGYRFLDLGTSSLGNKTNFSLLNFKTQVGCVPSMKLTFEKEL